MHPLARFAYDGERFRQQVVERFAVGVALAELVRAFLARGTPLPRGSFAGALDFTGTLPQQVPVAADDTFGDAGRDKAVRAAAIRLAREEALFAGTSSGANVVAAIRVARGTSTSFSSTKVMLSRALPSKT